MAQHKHRDKVNNKNQRIHHVYNTMCKINIKDKSLITREN